MDMHYAIIKPVSTTYEETIDAVKKALMDQGFGVLTEIDVSATLKKKLDVDYPKTIILGACNPKFAYQVLCKVPDVSVLLPCNVVVRENAEGQVEVAAFNPQTMAPIIGDEEIGGIADQVGQLINNALNALD